MHRYFLFTRKAEAEASAAASTEDMPRQRHDIPVFLQELPAGQLPTCIKDLPEKYRKVIQLCYVENQRIHEIKATIGMSESTVRNRLGYGLYLLKKQMAKKPKNPV